MFPGSSVLHFSRSAKAFYKAEVCFSIMSCQAPNINISHSSVYPLSLPKYGKREFCTTCCFVCKSKYLSKVIGYMYIYFFICFIFLDLFRYVYRLCSTVVLWGITFHSFVHLYNLCTYYKSAALVEHTVKEITQCGVWNFLTNC